MTRGGTAALAAVALLAGCSGEVRRQRAPDVSIGGGSVIAPRYNARHYNWCATQHPGYRRFDNTFYESRTQRARCVSPYI